MAGYAESAAVTGEHRAAAGVEDVAPETVFSM